MEWCCMRACSNIHTGSFMQRTLLICIFSNSCSNFKGAFLDDVEWWIDASFLQICFRYQVSQGLQYEDSIIYTAFILKCPILMRSKQIIENPDLSQWL